MVMKKMLFTTGILLLITSTIWAQNVGTDRDLDAKIKKYKTYAWSRNVDQIPDDRVFIGPNGILVFNNESTRSKIKDAIKYELDARGYKMDNTNPDFFVTFMVSEQPADITTFNGYTTIHNGLEKVRTPEDVGTTHVKAGTVLINFIDSKSSKQVWRGFASGILQPDMVNDQSKVRSAISSIFSEYQYKAGGMANNQ
jgi:hypothetical protein